MAYGAKVEITAEGSTRYAEVRAGSSFESSSDPRVHFGLGAATRVDSIVIRWPSGQVDKLGPEAADQELVDPRKGTGSIQRRHQAAATRSADPTIVTTATDFPSKAILRNLVVISVFRLPFLIV